MITLFLIYFSNPLFRFFYNYLFNFSPEIFLLFSILSLICYKKLFQQRFNYIYSIIFIFICIIILISTSLLVYLVFINSFLIKFGDFFLINYKTSCMKILILLISSICLILFRHSLTKSQTNCLEYLICYLSINLMCLITLMVNTLQFIIVLIFLEFLVICFYILSSFNYENHGFLIFRIVPKRKLLYFSFFLTCLGILLFQNYIYITNFLLSHHFTDNYYLNLFILNRDCLLTLSIIFILIGLLFKMIIFHSPTQFIYYRKTPVLTIVFMHLIPKIVFFYFIIEFVYTNYYFILINYWVNFILLCMSLSCLIISIGMRRLFLKHFMEYFSLVNSGYLLLCFVPLTYESLYYSIYFLFVYIFVIISYGGILLFIDDQINPGIRMSFDFIFSNIEKQDYFTIILSIIFFFFFGLPPTRRDYPCSRGVPFNGVVLQWLVITSLLSTESYVIVFFLIFFNIIIFFFYVGTIIPFWYMKRNIFFSKFPNYLNLLLVEFIIYFIFIIIFVFVQFDNHLILNFLKTFYHN